MSVSEASTPKAQPTPAQSLYRALPHYDALLERIEQAAEGEHGIDVERITGTLDYLSTLFWQHRADAPTVTASLTYQSARTLFGPSGQDGAPLALINLLYLDAFLAQPDELLEVLHSFRNHAHRVLLGAVEPLPFDEAGEIADTIPAPADQSLVSAAVIAAAGLIADQWPDAAAALAQQHQTIVDLLSPATPPPPSPLYTQAQLDAAVSDARRDGRIEFARELGQMIKEDAAARAPGRWYSDQEIDALAAIVTRDTLQDALRRIRAGYHTYKDSPHPDLIEAIDDAASARGERAALGWGVVNQPDEDTRRIVRYVAELIEMLRDTYAGGLIVQQNPVLWRAALAILDEQREGQHPGDFRFGLVLALDAIRALPDLGGLFEQTLVVLRRQLAATLPAGTLDGHKVQMRDAA